MTSKNGMTSELESTWKEAVFIKFSVLSQYLLEWTEETHEEPRS
jgi:hypothetical protein